ncbi:MAG: hypothetical protein K2V38_11595, partial [Gemmataceae bacterium]|nr:hypothetical protein [Gemmataceae bacterium]
GRGMAPETRKAFACVLVGLVVATTARAEWPRHTARPQYLPGVPGYDYRPAEVRPAATLTAVSLEKVNVAPTLPGQPARPAALTYQLAQARLQVDHCFLSRVGVALHESGEYQISFRADQNPLPALPALPGDARSPLRPGEVLNVPLQTAQLRRNVFVVKVRGYTAAPVGQVRPNLVPGTPAVIEFPPMEFVVERGEPLSKTYTGKLAAVEKYLPLIDRVEVEFTYK